MMDSLPRIKKEAERRIKDRLPVPTACPHCGGDVALVSNAEVYGRPYGVWPWIYLCQNPDCRAYIGTHPDTRLPLGTLATAELRLARKKAKEQFNRVWELGLMSKTEAYGWLATQLNIPQAACHFGRFTEPQCLAALAAIARAQQPVAKTQHAADTVKDLRAMLASKLKH